MMMAASSGADVRRLVASRVVRRVAAGISSHAASANEASARSFVAVDLEELNFAPCSRRGSAMERAALA